MHRSHTHLPTNTHSSHIQLPTQLTHNYTQLTHTHLPTDSSHTHLPPHTHSSHIITHKQSSLTDLSTDTQLIHTFTQRSTHRQTRSSHIFTYRQTQLTHTFIYRQTAHTYNYPQTHTYPRTHTHIYPQTHTHIYSQTHSSHIHLPTDTHTFIHGHTHTPETNTHSNFLLSSSVGAQDDLQGAGADLVEVTVQDASVEKRRRLHQAEKAHVVVGVQGRVCLDSEADVGRRTHIWPQLLHLSARKGGGGGAVSMDRTEMFMETPNESGIMGSTDRNGKKNTPTQ